MGEAEPAIHQLGAIYRVFTSWLPSAEEMARLVDELPADWNDDKNWRYYVIYLRHAIDSKGILTALNPKADIEQVSCVPGTLLLSARVKDLTRATMVKLSSHKMFQDMTGRNVNTTRELNALMQKYR